MLFTNDTPCFGRKPCIWNLLLMAVISSSCTNNRLNRQQADAALLTSEALSETRKNIADYTISSAGIALLKKFEGYRRQPYICPGGTLTVGYGQVIASQAEFNAQYPNGFSEADAHILLCGKLTESYASDIKRLVNVPLLQREFDMLVSLDYNIGSTALHNPTSKAQNRWTPISLLPPLNASRYEEAALAFPKFTKGGPEQPYYRGLLKRRMTEMFVFRNSTNIPQALRIPIVDTNFRRVTKCDSIAKYWEESGQQSLREEAIALYKAYNSKLSNTYGSV